MSAAVKIRTRFTLDEAKAVIASGEASLEVYAWANTVVSLHTAIAAYEQALKDDERVLADVLASRRGGR